MTTRRALPRIGKLGRLKTTWSKTKIEWDGWLYKRRGRDEILIYLPKQFFHWFSINTDAEICFRKFVFLEYTWDIIDPSPREHGLFSFSQWLDASKDVGPSKDEINAVLSFSKDYDDERFNSKDLDFDIFHQKDNNESINRLLCSLRLPYHDCVYSSRNNKSETAPEFLKRIYGKDIAEKGLSYSDIRLLDRSLWDALRRWARSDGNEISSLLTIGRTTRGRVPTDIPTDSLDPSDPVHALALKQLRQLELNRERVRRHRQASISPK